MILFPLIVYIQITESLHYLALWTFERFYPMGHVLINKVAPPFSKIRKKLKMNKVIYLHSNKKTNPHSYVPLIFRSALAQSIIDTKV